MCQNLTIFCVKNYSNLFQFDFCGRGHAKWYFGPEPKIKQTNVREMTESRMLSFEK